MKKIDLKLTPYKRSIRLKNIILLLILSFVLNVNCFDQSGGQAVVDPAIDESGINQPGLDSNYVPGIRNHKGYMRLDHSDFTDNDQYNERCGNNHNDKHRRPRHINMFDTEIKGILITITSIEINSEAEGWTEIANYGDRGKTIDLMQFTDGDTAEISYFNLNPGVYSQIRVHLTRENTLVIEKNGSYMLKSLRVPGHVDPEIRIAGSFEVQEAGLTSITVKFDHHHSIHFNHGHGFMLHPAFTIMEVTTTPSVTETISSENGGEINVFGELSAQMPAAAFPEDTDVTLTLIGTPVIMPFSSTFILGNAYEMGPLGTRLGTDMTLVMNYLDSEIAEKEVDESSLDIYYFDDSRSDWFRTSGSTDTLLNTVTTGVDTFTMFGIGGLPLTAPRIDPAAIAAASNGTGTSQVPLKVTATIKDPDGISNAILYYREAGDLTYNVIDMTAAGNDVFDAVIPLGFFRDQLLPAGIEVFIESADNSGEVSFAPVTASLGPHLYAYNPDIDSDGMNDRWEIENGLNITIDDSALDPDNDGVTNIEEYAGSTDPQVPEFIPAPEDIDSTCTVLMQALEYKGDTWDFPQVNSTITVIPPNSAEEFRVEWSVSFIRLYIIAGDTIILANKTDSVAGDTGAADYIEPSMAITLYDDYLHIEEFYTVINGKQWTPLPVYDGIVANYTAAAWNSTGGFYSEDFNFSF